MLKLPLEFNLQSIVKFLIIIVMDSFTTADLLCEERAKLWYVGALSFCYIELRKLYLQNEKRSRRKAEKNVLQQAILCNTNVIG